MVNSQKIKHKFGLIGKNISYSFSKDYFSKKFIDLELKDYMYQNFDIDSIKLLPEIITNEPNLKGLNVTIPYKETVLKYLDEIDDKAKKIGAVNTIKIFKDSKLKGFNTDVYGFENSIKPLLKKHHKKALILGTGGASKAISYVLQKLEIDILFVSRNPVKQNEISYVEVSKKTLKEYTIIINCSPVGTQPNINTCPNIPYRYLNKKHLLYDLIYNPTQTLFLSKGLAQGCTICNGEQMLELQAEEAWQIWNS